MQQGDTVKIKGYDDEHLIESVLRKYMACRFVVDGYAWSEDELELVSAINLKLF